MENEKRKGILSKIFGGKKSCCCNVKIEEVKEEQKIESEEKSQTPSGSTCCCNQKATKMTQDR